MKFCFSFCFPFPVSSHGSEMTTKSSTDNTTDLCLPSGFRYAGIACGIKESGDPDLALIVSDRPCIAAGVYTQNIVRAACIEWNEAITPGLAKSVVINSGNANACTGQTGQKKSRTRRRMSPRHAVTSRRKLRVAMCWCFLLE